jgi:hypothetical protein
LPDSVTLAQRPAVPALKLGERTLACVVDGAQRRLLLGRRRKPVAGSGGALRLQRPPCAAALQGLTGEATLLCPTRDEQNQFCTATHRCRRLLRRLQLDHAG